MMGYSMWTTLGLSRALAMFAVIGFSPDSVSHDPRDHPERRLRWVCEQSLRQHVRAEHEDHLRGRESDRRWLIEFEVERERECHLPVGVQESISFYRLVIEARDIGSARVIAVPLVGEMNYLVHTKTDGDDGWLEVFDRAGNLVGASRTYIEMFAWEDLDSLRAQAREGTIPGALLLMREQTLWRRPFDR